MKKALLILCSIAAVCAVNWFPEGDAPTVGSDERRSLQKINNLLYSGGAMIAPATNVARTVTWKSGWVTVTGSNTGLGDLLGFGSGSLPVRRVILRTSVTNTVDVFMGPSDATGPQSFSPDSEYLIQVPDGGVFSLNNWSASCATAGQTVGIFYCF